jgi:CRP-like cAMP-binding protein
VTVEELQANVLFEDIPVRHLKKIAKMVAEREVDTDEIVVREGTFSREFFLVISGSATVSVRGRKREVIGPGRYFGELAIINKSARTATITAMSPMRLGVIDAQSFTTLLESEPSLAYHLLQSLSRELEWMLTRPAGELK